MDYQDQKTLHQHFELNCPPIDQSVNQFVGESSSKGTHLKGVEPSKWEARPSAG